ncbi:MAG: MFS transporter [Armatimonadota bacterium]
MAEPMSVEDTSGGYVRRNFKLGVINGSIWLLARALIDPDTILPAFAVALMGANPLYVGLLVSVVEAGWFWPPLVMTSRMSTRERRHPYYQASAVVRVIALFAAAAAAYYLASSHPLAAFIAVGLSYLIFSSGGGVGLIPFMSVVTDSVPPDRRGKFFAMRFFFGGLMAFGAGFWVKWLLGEESGLSFPHNYGVLFAVAAVLATIALGAWWFAREPRHKVETRSLSLGLQLLRGLRRLRRRPPFRRLVLSRVMMSASYGLIVPFLVPYAYTSLAMAEAMVGFALASRVLCYSMFNIIWSRLSRRYGNRFLLIVGGATHLAGVTLVLLTPLMPEITLGTVLGLEFDLKLAVLMLCFGAMGAARSGQDTGQNAYLLDFTPERTRPVYFATYYLISLPMAFMPLATGLLIGTEGRYLLSFGLAAAATLVTIGIYISLTRLRGERGGVRAEGDGHGEDNGKG